jgi:predicted dithiol-disulfide oxidoreductase (DUF899 family)
MNYRDNVAALAAYRSQIVDIRKKMREIQAAVEPESVSDYTFTTSYGTRPDGTTRLADLFGAKNELFVIHNMGASCAYCTLWADGYNGVYEHLANRAAFVVCSPDAPDVQRRFAAGRGWRFPMVSHAGTSFAADMGYRSETRGWLPGVSVFRREADRIVRVADTGLSPGDDFCTVWHLLDLLPEGAAGWSPRYSYG